MPELAAFPLGSFPDWARMELRDPLFLWLALLAPLLYALVARPPAQLTYSTLALADRAPRSWRARLATLPAWLLAAAVVALAIALAGPRTGDASTRVRREGIAIAIAIDRSGSMRARDFVQNDSSVSRLDVVKSVFRRFVNGGEAGRGRPDDLIGLVAFARYADGLCPLTLDHANLTAILEQVEIPTDPQEDGTAVGEGLALAVERLRRHDTSRVAILLTDGVSNAGDIEPLQAAELAAQYGIKVYAIGAGSTGYAPVPVQVRGGRTVLRRAYVEIDEDALREIAERTGGRYFRAGDATALERAISEIDELERSELTEVRYLEYEQHYPAFVGAAGILVALAALLSASALRRLP